MIRLFPSEFDSIVSRSFLGYFSLTDEDVNNYMGRQLFLPAEPLAPECFLWFLCGTQAS